MRRVTLEGTGIRTTALGFGTATLMGRLSKRESLRLLAAAYEHGIRHFDTAPSYGYGESEALLGTFLRRHCDVTVATKFGLYGAGLPSPAFAFAKELARPALAAFPSLAPAARNALHRAAPAPDFSVAAASRSLATSLRRLGTGRIDVFLLHECRRHDLADDGLMQFLERARERGDIGAFGMATDVSTIASALESAPAYASVIQFANNEREPSLERNPLLRRHACITHSPFRGAESATTDAMRAALSFALADNPSGIVLFGSQSVQHVVSNASALE